MKYALAVLTHGEHGPGEAIRSLRAAASELPAMIVSYHDPGMGFCHGTRELWRQVSLAAFDENIDYVFWLEHDFRFLNHVPVDRLQAVLEDHWLAQVALMRQPVNEAEKAAGGVVASRPGRFWPQAGGYLLHEEYFTTNPSMMRTSFMLENPWPEDGEECEGKFGIALRIIGYRFAVWGDGKPWVEHVGELRTGKGY